MRKLLFIVLAVAVGALLGVLFAPQSGKKTRKKIKKQTRRFQLELEAQTEKNYDRLNNWKNSVEELTEDAVKKMNGSTSAAGLN